MVPVITILSLSLSFVWLMVIVKVRTSLNPRFSVYRFLQTVHSFSTGKEDDKVGTPPPFRTPMSLSSLTFPSPSHHNDHCYCHDHCHLSPNRTQITDNRPHRSREWVDAFLYLVCVVKEALIQRNRKTKSLTKRIEVRSKCICGEILCIIVVTTH